MRAVIQRVKRASVKVDNKIIGKINNGLLVFLAISKEDEEKDIDFMVKKVINLRIFEDNNGKMNLSLLDNKNYELLIVSQFTLYGDVRKGYRPNFIKSANREKAISFYNKFIDKIRNKGIKVATGEFGAMMEVELINDGPVTIIINS